MLERSRIVVFCHDTPISQCRSSAREAPDVRGQSRPKGSKRSIRCRRTEFQEKRRVALFLAETATIPWHKWASCTIQKSCQTKSKILWNFKSDSRANGTNCVIGLPDTSKAYKRKVSSWVEGDEVACCTICMSAQKLHNEQSPTKPHTSTDHGGMERTRTNPHSGLLLRGSPKANENNWRQPWINLPQW